MLSMTETDEELESLSCIYRFHVYQKQCSPVIANETKKECHTNPRDHYPEVICKPGDEVSWVKCLALCSLPIMYYIIELLMKIFHRKSFTVDDQTIKTGATQPKSNVQEVNHFK